MSLDTPNPTGTADTTQPGTYPDTPPENTVTAKWKRFYEMLGEIDPQWTSTVDSDEVLDTWHRT
jgi:hypothetical protein